MESLSPIHIRLISPSSREGEVDWPPRLQELESNGFKVSYHKLEPDPSWPFYAGTTESRLNQLMSALTDTSVGIIHAVRGGYGSSDLLDLLPWHTLAKLPPKPIVGFSDISALHSAFFTKLGWKSVHGPMPATNYWKLGQSGDIESLLSVLRGEEPRIELPLLYLGKGHSPDLQGWGFGGCLSVLTNLIGTQYFPKTLEGSLVFLEDVGEHPARILRFLNQWHHSGSLKGVRGLVLGRFVDCERAGQASEAQLYEAIARTIHIPVWHCPLFGHCSPNWPLPIGRDLRIDGGTLTWDWDSKHDAKRC